MMNQPDLGKKIAELRKEKGLTQEELVEKCNLNVRTLQRIESGEVTPRSYTLKMLFTALDFDVHTYSGTTQNTMMKAGYIISGWLGQFNSYIIDLFNLKTNTMKKLTILSIPFLTLVMVLIFSHTANLKAQSKQAIRDKFEYNSSNEMFVSLFNAGKIDSLCMLYLDNACMMPDQYATLFDRQSIQAYYTHLYNSGMRFTEIKTTSQVVSENIAIDRGTWTISIHSIIVASGTYLTQWHYLGGNWYIENEMTKSDMANSIDEDFMDFLPFN